VSSRHRERRNTLVKSIIHIAFHHIFQKEISFGMNETSKCFIMTRSALERKTKNTQHFYDLFMTPPW
jgi:hypothetical protein